MERCSMCYVRIFYLGWDDPLPGTEDGEVEYELTVDRGDPAADDHPASSNAGHDRRERSMQPTLGVCEPWAAEQLRRSRSLSSLPGRGDRRLGSVRGWRRSSSPA